MLKLTVALLLVALALNASAKPTHIAARALRHARTTHNALKTNSIFDDDMPTIERQNNNIVGSEDDDDKEFEKELEEGLKKFEAEIMKALVQGLQELTESSLDAQHHPKIREIFNKYPQPDFNSESSVDQYLENVGKDLKEYIKSKGLEDPFGFSEEDDISTNEV